MSTQAASGRDFVNLSKAPYNMSPSATAAANTAAIIQAATDHRSSATTAGKKLYLPGFSSPYLFNQTTLTSPAAIEGDGYGSSVIQLPAGVNFTMAPWRFRNGSPAWNGVSHTTLANQVTAGDTVITGIGSTSGWTAGGMLCIGAGNTTGQVPGTNSGAWMAEWVRIKSVDSATQVTLWGPVEETYPTTWACLATQQTFWQGCEISGITFDNQSPGSTPANTDDVGGAMCVIRGLARPVFDVEVINGSGAGFVVDTCHDFEGTVHVRDLLDNTSIGELGYGCLLWNGCQYGNVKVHATRCRHGVTTGGEAMGIPRHNTVSGTVRQNTGTAFDTHAEGKWTIFRDCHVSNMNNTDYSTDEGSAFDFRAPFTKILGGHVYQARGHIVQTSATSGTDCEIDGLTVHGQMTHPLASAQGISLGGARSSIMNSVIVDPSPTGSFCVRINADGVTVARNIFRQTIASGGSPVDATASATNAVVAHNIARGTWGATFISGTTTGVHGGAAGDNNLIVA